MNHTSMSPILALSGMGLALTLALAVGPESRATAAASPVGELVERGADHIGTRELAERLSTDRERTVLVDVREVGDYEAWHLPGAIRFDVPDLLGAPGDALWSAHPGALFVLYSNGMTHPAQAWMELARRGRTDVRVLEDGLDGYVRDVLTPPSLRGEVASEGKASTTGAIAAWRPFADAAVIPQDAKPAPRPAAEIPTAQGAPVVAAKPFGRLATDPESLVTPTIVSTAWVAKHANSIVLVDAREKAEDYAAGHLSGARHVPTGALRETRDGVPDQLLRPEALAARIGALGIDADTQVVAYGDEKLQDPAHFALALISIGHQRVAILEGGLAAWKAESKALTSDVPKLEPRTYVARPSKDLVTVDLAAVKLASESGRVRILDVRPADAFRGDVTTEARGGHIPSSWSRPYTSDVYKGVEGLYWRPLDDLRKDYASLGLHTDSPVIVTCRTGHQASQTWFLMRYVLGYQDVRWYDGSWKEWAAHAELPVETGSGTPAAK